MTKWRRLLSLRFECESWSAMNCGTETKWPEYPTAIRAKAVKKRIFCPWPIHSGSYALQVAVAAARSGGVNIDRKPKPCTPKWLNIWWSYSAYNYFLWLKYTDSDVGKTGEQDHPIVTHESIHKKLQAHWHYGRHAPEQIDNCSGVLEVELPCVS